MQYLCSICQEPVSDEIEEPVLELDIVLICKQCQFTKVVDLQKLVWISLATTEDRIEHDIKMANELDAAIKYYNEMEKQQ